MSPKDAEILRNIRRELGKREFEANRLEIQVSSGRVTLSGMVTIKREFPLADLRHEFDTFQRILLRDPTIKQLSNGARIIEPKVEEEHKESGTRGRMRHQ